MDFRLLARVLAISAGSLCALCSAPAAADEQPYVLLYSTDLEEQGTGEIEQWLSWADQHTHASFQSFESRTEFEYGITSNFQGSLYLNYDWSHERDRLSGVLDRDSFAGVSGELIYRLLDDERDPIGLAVYLEPSWGAEEREVEAKILLQKNFFGEALRLDVNINLEDTWDRDHGIWEKGSALEFRTGLAYAPTPDWSVAAEFSNENEYDGLLIGGSAHAQSSAYYLGPTFQYSFKPITVTLGAEAQLPWASGSVPGAVEHGFSSDAERYRVLLRFNADI